MHAGTAALSAQGFDLAFDATNPQALDNNYARWTSAFLGTSAKLTFSFKQIELNDYAEVGCFLDLLGDENGADLLAVGPSLASDFNFVSTLYLAGNQITAAGRRGTVPMPPRGTFVEASILIELDRAANRFLITGTMNGTTVQVDDLEANLNPRFIQVRCGLIHSAKVTGRQAGSVDNVVLTTCNP